MVAVVVSDTSALAPPSASSNVSAPCHNRTVSTGSVMVIVSMPSGPLRRTVSASRTLLVSRPGLSGSFAMASSSSKTKVPAPSPVTASADRAAGNATWTCCPCRPSGSATDCGGIAEHALSSSDAAMPAIAMFRAVGCLIRLHLRGGGAGGIRAPSRPCRPLSTSPPSYDSLTGNAVKAHTVSVRQRCPSGGDRPGLGSREFAPAQPAPRPGRQRPGSTDLRGGLHPIVEPMYAVVTAAAVVGVQAILVRVEAFVSGGLPNFTIVGLPGAAVQESRERVRAALKQLGLPLAPSRIVVNLAPADVRKQGPAFDLPIALAVLGADGHLPAAALRRYLAVGELALDGGIRSVAGVVSVGALAAEAELQLL